MALIEFQNVSKWFPHSTGRALLRTHIAHWFGGEQKENFVALKNVSFRLEPGESLAVVGSNGAGKSTLLSLAAGLATPNAGRVTVNGHLAALLELGSGFHPDLTGAENLLLNSALLGRSRKQTLDLADKIIDFSGIRDFIDDPLRNYSSGMVMRLAFSIAIHTEPDIMLLDEVLAVGDAGFQTKCREALLDFQRAGKSILFVSHSAGQVQEMCERAIWLDHGELVMEGDAGSVLEAYSGGLVLKQQAGEPGA
ncbi:MAG TPA: ABC transporter ATP-binding protein [Bryobacteraceae bacterium]|jgi:ABC-type polysaccharide/polyol phosphate transport system ATPase subunit|nr:ABC transporter ATP-binding protein [Bryobacteraceae bacterium]